MEKITFSRLSVVGEDAQDFLNRITSIDCIHMTQSGYAAICNPLGKVTTLFFIQKINLSLFHLFVPTDIMDALEKQLTLYKLRSKITLERQNDVPFPTEKGNEIDFIEKGIPWIGPKTSNKFLANELSLDALDAISYSKGCYPGQEINTRMHQQKIFPHKLCYALSKEKEEENISPFHPVYSDNLVVGNVILSSNKNGKTHLLASVLPSMEINALLEIDSKPYELIRFF